MLLHKYYIFDDILYYLRIFILWNIKIEFSQCPITDFGLGKVSLIVIKCHSFTNNVKYQHYYMFL